MADPAHKDATYADLEAVPANLVAEIIHGALVTHPRPSPRHGRATTRLGAVLGAPFDLGAGGPGGWVFIVEPELHLGGDVVVPDIAGWRRERLPGVPDTNWISVAPDWVCEVLSPSTASFDRGAKRDIYASAGVLDLWLINPAERNLEAFHLVAGKWLLQTTITGADEVKIPPFDAAPFSLGLLWPFDVSVEPGKPST